MQNETTIMRKEGWIIGSKLGSGGFGHVFLAKRKTYNGPKKFAVKIIERAASFSKYLERELEIWPNLKHQAIIQVEKLYTFESRCYAFMELAVNGTVMDHLTKHGAVSDDVARMWAKSMFSALEYCHVKGVAHRDLKLQNLLLDGKMQLKVADFGLSCLCFTEQTYPSINLTETFCGTYSYWPPEMLNKMPYDATKADIWSAGVCLFIFVNARLPFRSVKNGPDKRKKLYEQRASRNYRFVDEFIENGPEGCKLLINDTLNPDVTSRPSARDILSYEWLNERK